MQDISQIRNNWSGQTHGDNFRLFLKALWIQNPLYFSFPFSNICDVTIKLISMTGVDHHTVSISFQNQKRKSLQRFHDQVRRIWPVHCCARVQTRQFCITLSSSCIMSRCTFVWVEFLNLSWHIELFLADSLVRNNETFRSRRGHHTWWGASTQPRNNRNHNDGNIN